MGKQKNDFANLFASSSSSKDEGYVAMLAGGGIIAILGVFIMAGIVALSAMLSGVTISLYYDWFVIWLRDNWLVTFTEQAFMLPDYVTVGVGAVIYMTSYTFIMPALAAISAKATPKEKDTNGVWLAFLYWPILWVTGFFFQAILFHSFLTPMLFGS